MMFKFKLVSLYIIVLLALFQTIGYAGDTSNLEGAWLLDETSGTRIDETANSNDLTDNNTVLSSTGQFGNAADFEVDNSEYLSITNGSQTGLLPSGNTSITLGCWINFESEKAQHNIIGSFAGGGQDYFALITVDNGSNNDQLRIVFNTGAGTGTADGTTNLGTPTSHSAGLQSTTADFFIGHIGQGTNYMDGLADECFMFSRELSTSEISDIMNNGLESFIGSDRNRVVVIT